MSILRCFAFSSYFCLSTFISSSFVSATSLFSFTCQITLLYSRLQTGILIFAYCLCSIVLSDSLADAMRLSCYIKENTCVGEGRVVRCFYYLLNSLGFPGYIDKSTRCIDMSKPFNIRQAMPLLYFPRLRPHFPTWLRHV